MHEINRCNYNKKDKLKNKYGWEYNSLQTVDIKLRMRWAAHVARMENRRGAYRILVGRHEGKRTLGRPRRRPEENIKTDLKEGRWRRGVDWIDLALRLRIRTSGRVL